MIIFENKKKNFIKPAAVLVDDLFAFFKTITLLCILK